MRRITGQSWIGNTLSKFRGEYQDALIP
jgi:hypothetical protein